MMKARMRGVALLLTGMVLAPGCTDSQGRITMASIREFWAGVDRRCRADLARLGLVPPALPSLWGPAGRPEVNGPPYGTLFASRQGDLVVVEVHLADVPRNVKTLSAGLKLRNGVVVQPRSIRCVRDTAAHQRETPRVEFDFADGTAPQGPRGEPDLALCVTYEAHRTISVDRSTFTLVLGEPGCAVSCAMGITAAVSIEDGGPTLTGCVLLPRDEAEEGGPPPLLEPPSTAPMISFRFQEPPRQVGTDPIVWITPAVASVYPDGPPHKTIAARTELLLEAGP